MTGQYSALRFYKVGIAVIPAWIAFVWMMFVPNWHPLSLVARMLPVIPQDVIAGLVRLSVNGAADLAMLSLVLFSALGLGGLMLRLFRLDMNGGPSRIISLGLGLAALSYLTLFVGLVGMYDSVGLAIMLAVLVLTAFWGARSEAESLRALRSIARPAWPDIAFFALLFMVSSFLAAKALWPAVFYDAITYHLGVPNYYLQEGGIGYIPYDSYSNFPFAAEMLYTLGMFVSGLGLAQLMSVTFFIVCVLLVREFTRRFLPDVPSALPAAFVLLTPAFMENSILYLNDLHLMFYSFLVVYCYFSLEKMGGYGWASLMGVFTGVCIGTKYIALVSICVPASLAVGYIAYMGRAKGLKAVLKTLFAFSIPAVVVASPWLIKNLAYTGNPFYPAFFGIFGGRDMTEELYAVHAMNHPSVAEGLRGLVTHPWKLFMAAPSYLTDKYRAASFLGPVVVLVLPVGLFLRDVDQVIKKLMLYVLLLFFMWSMAFPLTRYLYPAVAALLIISAYAVIRVYRVSPGLGKYVLAPAAAVGLVFNICLGFFLADQWTNAYGFEHVDETDRGYLERRIADGGAVMLQSLPIYEYINENTPVNSRVLVIGDAQHLYIKRRHMYTYLSARTPYDVFYEMKGGNPSVYRELNARGITHIVYSPGELERLSGSGFIKPAGESRRNIEDFLRSVYVKPVLVSNLTGRPVYLFELAVPESTMPG